MTAKTTELYSLFTLLKHSGDYLDHLCHEFRLDLRCLKLRVAEGFLYLLDRHSAFKQCRCDRMTRQMRIDALLDLRFLRDLLHDLLHAPR
jgi:hypothetical protein